MAAQAEVISESIGEVGMPDLAPSAPRETN